jgi:hypothetical protein
MPSCHDRVRSCWRPRGHEPTGYIDTDTSYSFMNTKTVQKSSPHPARTCNGEFPTAIGRVSKKTYVDEGCCLVSFVTDPVVVMNNRGERKQPQ